MIAWFERGGKDAEEEEGEEDVSISLSQFRLTVTRVLIQSVVFLFNVAIPGCRGDRRRVDC